MDYITENHSKCRLKIHLIFVVKYRKKLLVGRLGAEVKNIFEELQTSSIRTDVMEINNDHIHFLIDYDPKISVLSIVRKFKQISTNRIWKICDLSNQFWKERTFWSDGYFVCSIGDAYEETIRKYIENQV